MRLPRTEPLTFDFPPVRGPYVTSRSTTRQFAAAARTNSSSGYPDLRSVTPSARIASRRATRIGRDVVHGEAVSGAQPPAHRRGTHARVPRPAQPTHRPAPPDCHVGACHDVGNERRQLSGVHRPVTVDHGHDVRRRGDDSTVHSRPVTRSRLEDHFGPAPACHVGRAVGAVVVDHQRPIVRRHGGQHPGQAVSLVETRQYHRDRTVVHIPRLFQPSRAHTYRFAPSPQLTLGSRDRLTAVEIGLTAQKCDLRSDPISVRITFD